MYARFEIQKEEIEKQYIDEDLCEAKLEYVNTCEELTECLKNNIYISYRNRNDYIDVSALENDWFPQINADVFISHSHRDLDSAIKLANILKDRYDLDSFIDSTVWSDYRLLIEQLQDLVNTKEASDSIATHTSLILLSSLARIIDKTECFIFIDSDNSLSISAEETSSPWIYQELLLSSKFARKKSKRRLTEYLEHSADEIKFKYKVNLDQLVNLSFKDLDDASNSFAIKMYGYDKYKMLDALYINKSICEKKK